MPFTEAELEFLAGVFDAARRGDAPYLRQVLDAGLPPNLTNQSGDTPLILAAYHRHGDAVAVLLEHGADTERVNDRGQTALASAVFRRDEAIVRQLLDAGAGVDTGERSARAIAAYFGLDDMAALLGEPARAFLFDMDDTLLLTREAKWAHHRQVARDHYGIELDDATLAEHWGKPFDEMIGLL